MERVVLGLGGFEDGSLYVLAAHDPRKLAAHGLPQADRERYVVISGCHMEFHLGVQPAEGLTKELLLDVSVNGALKKRHPSRFTLTKQRPAKVVEIRHVRPFGL